MAGPSNSLGVDAYLERNQTVRNLIQKEDEEEEEEGKGVADGPKTVCKKNVTKMRDTDLTQELWGNEDDDDGIREKEGEFELIQVRLVLMPSPTPFIPSNARYALDP